MSLLVSATRSRDRSGARLRTRSRLLNRFSAPACDSSISRSRSSSTPTGSICLLRGVPRRHRGPASPRSAAAQRTARRHRYRRKFRRNSNARNSSRAVAPRLSRRHYRRMSRQDLIGKASADRRRARPASAGRVPRRPRRERRAQRSLDDDRREPSAQAARQARRRPSIHMGFSDAGAHLRNMAFYNFSLRLLKRTRDAERAGDRS